MHTIGRRKLLTGLGLGAGSSFFYPLVTELCREAHGQAKPEARLVLIRGHWSYEDRWSRLPAVRGPGDFDLPPTMEPLAPHRSSLWMVFNMSHPGVGANGGHGIHTPDFLSCMRSPTYTGRTGISFDRFLAQRLGSNDRFPSVSLSPSGGTSSFDGPDKAYPGMKDPLDAFDKLFAQGLAGDGVESKLVLAQDRSTLDFVKDDVGRLNTRLAGPEREKLDRYLESLRQVEKKLSLVVPRTCNLPERPTTAMASEVARTELLTEIGAVAIACGVTHVLSISTPDDWVPLGASEKDGHEVVHKGTPVMAEVHKWRMRLVASTYQRLRDLGVSESSLVLYTDANGTVHHGGTGNHQFVLGLGTLGGYFKTPNVIQYARDAKTALDGPARGLGEVFVSIANAMGVDIGVFGLASHCLGPMPGLRV